MGLEAARVGGFGRGGGGSEGVASGGTMPEKGDWEPEAEVEDAPYILWLFFQSEYLKALATIHVRRSGPERRVVPENGVVLAQDNVVELR